MIELFVSGKVRARNFRAANGVTNITFNERLLVHSVGLLLLFKNDPLSSEKFVTGIFQARNFHETQLVTN